MPDEAPQRPVWQTQPTPRGTSGTRRRVALAIVALAAIVAAVAVVLWKPAADPTDYGLSDAQQQAAPDVSMVAAEAAKAADDVDIQAGLDLMCSRPMSAQLVGLERWIDRANRIAGGVAQKKIVITDVKQDGYQGSFTVRVRGQGALAGHGFAATAQVENEENSRWCIVSYEIDPAG